MAVHNLVMYHCQKCGRLVNQEFDEAIPYCCGRAMTKAAEKNVPAAGKQAGSSSSTGQADAQGPQGS